MTGLEEAIHAIRVETGNIPGVISLTAKLGAPRVIDVTVTGTTTAAQVFAHLNGYPVGATERKRCFRPPGFDIRVTTITPTAGRPAPNPTRAYRRGPW
jgi:hypothetical protein